MNPYFQRLTALLVSVDNQALNDCIGIIRAAKVIYAAGNGGSAANAGHLALHLIEAGKSAMDVSAETPTLTALANDHGYAGAWLRQLRVVGSPGDVLVVISGSGDSPNVLAVLAEAKRIGMKTVGLLGFGGGAALNLCNGAVVLASRDYGPVEDVHSAIIHCIALALKGSHLTGG